MSLLELRRSQLRMPRKVLGIALVPAVLCAAAAHNIELPWTSHLDVPQSSAVRDPDLKPMRQAASRAELSFAPQRASFGLRVRGSRVQYRVLFTAVLPEEVVELRVSPEEEATSILIYSAGRALPAAAGTWRWQAPARPGSYAVRVSRGVGEEFIHINAFVMHPRSAVKNEVLNGYRIGRYQTGPLRGDPVYSPPVGFIEVPSDAEDVLVSPHLTIGQFLCKQPGDPRYLVLSRPLVVKLEAILQGVNEAGYPAETLHIMSGFRTPWYNRAIGNRTVYSRHLWGDAADLFLDVDGDGYMDDLNGDGTSDIQDVRILLDIATRVDSSGRAEIRAGGLGVYRKNAARGPFLHVDARGRPARW